MKYVTPALRQFYRGAATVVVCWSVMVWAKNPDHLAAPVMAQDSPDTTAQSGIYNPKDQQVAALQTRLVPFLNEQGIERYHAVKAAAWLTYAAHEGSEKSATVARKEALAQAEMIIVALEQGQAKQLSLTTPILSTSSVMRRDLWANTELLKQHACFSCAQSQIAQAEVMLVWAAAEHCELGWRHSRELFLSAQRLIDQANSRAFSCSADVPQQLPKISYPSLQELNGSEQGCHGVVGTWPIWSPQQKTVISENSQVADQPVPNVVHFALDQAVLSQDSINVLNQIVNFLTAHPAYTLTLYGFTDQQANEQYNLKLSLRRAQAVSQYLTQQGVALNRIATEAKGKTQLIKNENPYHTNG